MTLTAGDSRGTDASAQAQKAGGRRAALGGLKVVEFGGFAAGPVVGKYLSNYGAEVIRVESRKRLDGFRANYPPFKDNIPGTDRAGIFNFFNDGKRSITLNLKTDQGVEIARRLVNRADVVVENFTPGTMARLGLGYDYITQDNPTVVMLSSCNQGQTGPHSGHPGFGTHLTSLSGFTQLLGEPGKEPPLLYGPYIDYIAVGYGLIAVLAALARRKRTGKGCYVDLSQYESGVQFVAPAMLDLFVNGRVADRNANHDAVAVPHGVFPCAGEDRWCAISVHDDAEWTRLVDALGNPDWAKEPVLATVVGRRQQERDIEERLASWTRTQERDALVEQLRAYGVHVYPVNSMADLFSDPQLQYRQHWRPVDHPVIGRAHVAAPPFLLRETPPVVERPAPLLGQHTEQVLTEILGYSAEQVEELTREGVLD